MYRIGIDLGGTNIAAGIVNEQYEILAQESTPTKAGRPGEEIVSDMAALCLRLCAKAGISESEVESLGIASPGVVDDKLGEVIVAYNLGFFHFPIIPLLKEKLNISTMHIANDANAAAWGEAIAGAGKGSSSSIMVTLGTGVGGGIILDNKLLTGFNEGAGELGHMVIQAGGRPCTCGRKGCWEAYASATGLINMTKVVNVKDQTSITHIMDMIPEVIDKIRSRNTEMISDEDAARAAFPDKNTPAEKK